MAGNYAQVTLISASGNSEDNQSNIFAVASPASVSAAAADDWRDAIKQFYDSCYANGALRGMAQNNHLIKFYEIPGITPNYPVEERTFNLGVAPAAIDQPMELALCVSYKNVSLNSVPRARRRGRIYISGWSETVNVSGRPQTSIYEQLADDYADYALAVNLIPDFTAGVWSRVDEEVYPIEDVWCDNEWDVQRRRGGKATARYTVGI
jgi:hypothetical protein